MQEKISEKYIKEIVDDTVRVDIATIQARIRNTYGIVDKKTCDHSLHWNIYRHICMRCGITKVELLEF